MAQPKKLIEVAMPVKEITAECLRDDRIQHGHISSLHKWWARRPLPVCRAVVFASLVPDPLDNNCPQAFKDAVKELLGQPFALETKAGYEEFKQDWYKPYTDIPYTAAHDLMEDNLRNRLLMFIGKYSDKFVENEKIGKTTNPKDQLSEASLIKWESRHSDTIISIARKLIWIAFNSSANEKKSIQILLADFDMHFSAIKKAEQELYSTLNRHQQSEDVRQKEEKRNQAIDAFLNRMPKVFDPFAGGGAIPLEASRLGCRSFGNDINPVAHIIQKGSLEFPQKFGKPITYSKSEFLKLYGEDQFNEIPNENKIISNGEVVNIVIKNRLSFDVLFYANKILSQTKEEIQYMYPSDENGEMPRVYYWVRVGQCMNPSCKAEVPLMKQFYLCNKPGKQIYLNPVVDGNHIDFEIKEGICDLEGWITRGNLICPCCKNITTSDVLKSQFITGTAYDRLVCIIKDGKDGKEYFAPSVKDKDVLKQIPKPEYIPNEKLPVKYTKAMAFCLWGFTEWGQLFSDRQLVAINTLIKKCREFSAFDGEADNEYQIAIKTYLGIWIDRMAARLTKFGIIDLGGEKVVDLFGLQAIQMVFDYPEVNLLKLEQLSWIERYIESESLQPFPTSLSNVSSGEKMQFGSKFITAVVTDPPYYDAVAYADLSDFFYIWLKKSIGSLYPLNFATPQTPKSEECTALKHHHDDNEKKARRHFEDKLSEIFHAIEYQTLESISIMFAHQSTEAWTTLCNSILNSKMNITGSWAIGTEKKGGLKENKAFLSSSVTVSCRPTESEGFASYKDVKKAIEERIKLEVRDLYKLGFRGGDLLTACFGKAVSEFGRFEKVEKADGSEVTVSELLEMARDSAFNALVKDFPADEFTKFYIAWAQFYGFTESDFDDVNRLVKIGLSIETNSLFQEKLLLKNGNKQSLAGYEQRVGERPTLGTVINDPIIDLVHKGMHYFKKNDRKALLVHISQVANSAESLFWRVINSLVEILPLDKDHDDKKIAAEMLANKDNLLRDSKQIPTAASQTTLGL